MDELPMDELLSAEGEKGTITESSAGSSDEEDASNLEALLASASKEESKTVLRRNEMTEDAPHTASEGQPRKRPVEEVEVMPVDEKRMALSPVKHLDQPLQLVETPALATFTEALRSVVSETKSVEEAMVELDILEEEELDMDRAAEAVCNVLSELPAANMWPLVENWSNGNWDELDEDGINRNRIVPKSERSIILLLLGTEKRLCPELSDIYEKIFQVLCARSPLHFTADACEVARITRCLLMSLLLSFNGENESACEMGARTYIYRILSSSSTEAAIRAIACVLVHPHCCPIVEWLVREGEDTEIGRLLRMHLTGSKDAPVFHWVIDSFIPEAKELEGVAWKSTVTADEVTKWWSDAVEQAEAEAKEEETSVMKKGNIVQNCCIPSLLQYSASIGRLISSAALMLSPRFDIPDLDRLALLAEIDTRSLGELDTVTAKKMEDTVGEIGMFADTSSLGRNALLSKTARVTATRLTLASRVAAELCSMSRGAEGEAVIKLHLRTLVEKAHAILSRTHSSPPTDEGLLLALTALNEWYTVVSGLSQYAL